MKKLKSGKRKLKKEVGYKKIFIKDGIKVGYFVLNSFVGENINDAK